MESMAFNYGQVSRRAHFGVPVRFDPRLSGASPRFVDDSLWLDHGSLLLAVWPRGSADSCALRDKRATSGRCGRAIAVGLYGRKSIGMVSFKTGRPTLHAADVGSRICSEF